jgi:hypothetical protein
VRFVTLVWKMLAKRLAISNTSERPAAQKEGY